jgi:hypothetical protein
MGSRMTLSKRNVAYNMLISLHKKLTRLNGVITPEAINRLEDKLGGILPALSPSQSTGSSLETKPEHTQHQMTRVHIQAALGIGNAAAQCRQLMAEHKILLKSYHDYLGVEEVGKELILYAVGSKALTPLKKQYIGFGDLLVLRMIDNLCLKTAIKMMMVQKHEYKTTVWNFTSHGLPFSKYSAILAKSPPSKILVKFHSLRKFPQNSICSGLRLNSNLVEILSCVWCTTEWHHTDLSSLPGSKFQTRLLGSWKHESRSQYVLIRKL